MADQAGIWTRVQSIVDGSGLPALLAMAARPVLPVVLAEDEAGRLKKAGARVLRDLTGRPCIREDDPVVTAWRAGLDERVTALAADIERAMQASRRPVLSEVDRAMQEAVSDG